MRYIPVIIMWALSATSFAQAITTTQVVNCPSIKAIVSAGLDSSRIFQNKKDHTWMLGKTGKYGTDATWIFSMQRVFAKDKAEAYKNAVAALSSLKLSKKFPAKASTGCLYYNTQGNIGFALAY